jgi:ABC-type cobalamin/Fe3+-siderophores transport system ATPase subunit
MESASRVAAFELDDVGFRYADAGRDAVSGAVLSVPAGSLTGVIGPNGSGKSTLLRLILGALRPRDGVVRYCGRAIGSWGRRELARSIGVVGQKDEMLHPVRIRELVAMGRYPHLGAFRSPGGEDERAVEAAMQRCAIADLADRTADHVSAGELQRARVARALAQEPRTFVLDEPTAQLDIAHEMAIFELLADLCRSDGATVVVVTHNLNLAARHADTLVLLRQGHIVANGPPADVIERDTIERVYGWPVRIAPHPGPGRDTGVPQVIALTTPDTMSGPPAGPVADV